jgi:hypothetical protein
MSERLTSMIDSLYAEAIEAAKTCYIFGFYRRVGDFLNRSVGLLISTGFNSGIIFLGGLTQE